MLSAEYLVSGDKLVTWRQSPTPALWANAKIGRVEKLGPFGLPIQRSAMPPDEDTGETTVVPTQVGIVLRFQGPAPLQGPSKEWSPRHDPAHQKFDVVVELPEKRFVGFTASYGAQFPKEMIEALMALSRVLPENHPGPVK